MDRRGLLKLLALGIAGHSLDLDRLLWVPGQKKIFIPSYTHTISMSEVIAIEYERIIPHLFELFYRDYLLYRTLSNDKVSVTSSKLISTSKFNI